MARYRAGDRVRDVKYGRGEGHVEYTWDALPYVTFDGSHATVPVTPSHLEAADEPTITVDLTASEASLLRRVLAKVSGGGA